MSETIQATQPAPASTPRNQPTPREHASRNVAVASCAALALLCLVWELALTGSWFWALKALPLLPALPGLWRYRLYTYRWVSLLLWLYVTEGLVHAASSSGWAQAAGAAEVTLSMALFVSVTAHIRWRLAAAKQTP
jgi:uncharacterized membrane protein